MDPKSCRQTPHWVIAMISSRLFSFQYTAPVLSYKKKMCFWAECFMLHRWPSAAGWVRNISAGVPFDWNLAPQSPGNATWGMCNVVWNYTVEYRPMSSVTVFFFHASLEAFISALNIAYCAPFEELLCVRRWRRQSCWGGAELVALGHGW